jgi:protein-L-isoaspartate(D-aspartate) O-methyltransferase
VDGVIATQAGLVDAVRLEGVADARLLRAFEEVPRAEFVRPECRERAYHDVPLPIPHAQVTTQPSLVAKMIEALSLEGSERVLEVGTGYGFQTALLARLASFVWSVERFEDVAEAARANLAEVPNVEVVTGDGTHGLAEHSPYDAIIVSAAFHRVPAALAAQLAPGGRLVQPLGYGGDEQVALFERTEAGVERRRIVTLAHFVRLVGEEGFARG